MFAVVEYLFGAASFMPHGYCLLWRPDLVAMHAVSDLMIGAAYFSIPVALFAFLRRRTDIAYPWVFRLFAAFILLCGTTHLVGLWTLWQPVYGLQGLVKLATAGVSIATAIALWPLLPRALALPSPAMLQTANDQLANEVVIRRESQEALRRAHDELEMRVARRTKELSDVNQQLAREVAERRRTESDLRQALQRLQRYMGNTPLGVIELELDDGASFAGGRISSWSGQAPAIFLWTADEVAGRTIEDIGLVLEEDGAKHAELLADLAAGRTVSAVFGHRCRTKQGEIRHCQFYASVVHGEENAFPTVLVLIEDITERVHADERIYRLAHHDLVTGLPNRLLFQDRMSQALARARRDGNKVGLMMLDLDRFKEINDSLGHAAGDQLLSSVAERLGAAVRESDTLARLGGDEFALIQTALASDRDAALKTDRVFAAMAEPVQIEGHETPISASIGVTLYPDDGETVEKLMRNADIALYRAKAAGRAMACRYDATMDHEIQASRSLQRQICEALERDQFQLAYQPIVELESRREVAREALLRLDHPTGGPIPPSVLIPIAEASGLIHRLGAWVMDRACRDLARWRAAGERVRVAVNLSAAQLRHGDLVPTVERMLELHRIDPALLELEITENVLLDASASIITDALDRLAAMGVTLALDDFGTGYSSLAYLKRFPFHAIKLDASFVQEIGTGEGSEPIVLAVLALGESLGKRVVAEGIESDEQLHYLAANGCHFGQGYLFGRPRQLAVEVLGT